MPGEKTYIYVPSDAQISADFAARLRATQYGGNYTYSPAREVPDPILGRVGETEFSIWGELKARGQAPFCTNNCTTVPAPEIETSIGGRLRTNSGVDVMTGVGPDGIVDPHYAGRARLTTEAVTSGEIPTGAQRLRITPAAGTSMFVIKGGGVILLVYGIYKTEERIRAAAGTDQINTVLAEETGSWTGGLLGSALGGAAAGAILCAPTGPVDAVCVIGGFLGGLLFGGAGAAVGSELGHASVNGRPPEGGIIDTITAPVVEPVKKFSDYLEFNIRGLYGIPTGSSF
jgi:hypothetical protein